MRRVNDGVNEILSVNQSTRDRSRLSLHEHRHAHPTISVAEQPPKQPLAHLYKNEWSSDDADFDLTVPYTHSTAAHQLIKWPFVLQSLQDRLNRSENILFESGIDWFLSLYQTNDDTELPSHSRLPANITDSNPLLDITYSNTMRYAKTYFDTFNYIHPLLDRTIFFQETLPAAMGMVSTATHQIDDEALLITLLVLALGELALYMITGDRTSADHYLHLFEAPPGLQYFNEVRKRLGFMQFGYSLAIVQIEAMISYEF